MFVWTKVSSTVPAEVWEDRLAAHPGTVITRFAGRRSVQADVYCETRSEAEKLAKEFGGKVSKVRQQNWAALEPELPPPVKVRDRLLICAEQGKKALSALAAKHPGRQIISIPPDMAFGTGHHPTTATVLRLLTDFAESRKGTPWTLCDLGTGSAVLAIAAVKLGCASAWGCDFDPLAVRVARENLSRNRAQNIELEVADVLKWKPRERYDLVAANIFYDILEAAFPRIVRAMKKDGIVLLSGILKSQAKLCLAAGERAGLRFERVITIGKWVTAQGRLAR